MKKSATISPCGAYRYTLGRTWNDTNDRLSGLLVWLMLNPSTADADADDPTIRRCVGLSRARNYGGIIVVNLYALRSTNPKALWKHPDPVGPDNDKHLIEAVTGRDVVAAWGANAKCNRVGKVFGLVVPLAKQVSCFGVTKGGAPRHPLYLPATASLVTYWSTMKV